MASTPTTPTDAEAAPSRLAQEVSNAAYAAEASTESPGPDTSTVTEKASELTDSVSEKASQARERAMETADQAREKTAEGVESAAGTLREQVEGKGGIQEAAGTRLADGMERTATYLREHDTQTMMEDIERYVREHPTQAILGAVAAGFIIGRILK
jgi:ElaB/YqjD/DUF883 family membrane-anchored ribosome-binding protein